MSRRMLPSVPLLVVALALAGCAGGWRNGAPPGGAAGAIAAPAAAAAKGGPVEKADGVLFTWKGEGSSVALAGEFNQWSTSADPMVKQADGSWTITKKLAPGKYQYKFVLDGGKTWKEDPAAAQSTDDGLGGKNSVIVIGGAGAGAAALVPPAKAAPAAKAGPAEKADGVLFTWKGEGSSVALAGEFNAWSTTADPMTKQADGSWTITKKLAPGKYQYKFVLDGGKTWKEDPGAAQSTDDGLGGKNSVIVVGGGAAPAPPAQAAAPTAPATPAAAKPAPGPVATPQGIVFTWTGEGQAVAVSGEFNQWSTTSDPMKQQADGTWTLTRKLPPGTYQYKFVIDGGRVWKEDPGATQSADDGMGGKNSVVVVK